MRTQPPPIAPSPLRRRWGVAPLLAGLLLAAGSCTERDISGPPPSPPTSSPHAAISSADATGTLVNGGNASGSITVAHQTDHWTFTAATGDYLVVSIGEVSGTADFTPWIRLVAPNGTVVGNAWNAAAAQISVAATQTGTYTVLAATADAGNDATGSYRLRLARAPATLVVPTGDQGGAMTNGATYSGAIPIGDLDQWKIAANAGDYLAVSIGEVTDTAGFTPWIRLVAPNGALVGNAWNARATQISVSATQTGTYTVIVSTADAGNDARGSYKITMAKGPGTSVVSTGDQGGTMQDGANHAGSIYVGDVDQWKFTATTGNYIALSIGEVSGTTDFTPWIRLVAPNGALVGNAWNAAAAQISVSATQTGTYTVIVGTADAGNDATGSYKLRLAKAPGKLVVPTGDQGGTMANGANYAAGIAVGDLDQWQFTATTGDYLAVSIGEVSGTTDFTPWIRLVAPNGALVGNAWNAAAAQISVAATQTGTYTVIVGTADAGNDATGKYTIRLAQAPEAFVVDSTDEGGTLANGVARNGTVTVGDLDQWTFNATQGHTVVVTINEVSGTTDFTPWIRLVAPNGTLLRNAWGASSATVSVVVPQTGAYRVIVGTADSGNDATGTYQISVLGANAASASADAAAAGRSGASLPARTSSAPR